MSRLSHTGPSRYKQDLLENFRLPFYEKSVCRDDEDLEPPVKREEEMINMRLKDANDEYFVRKICDDIDGSDVTYDHYVFVPISTQEYLTSSRSSTGKLSAVRRLLRQSELQQRGGVPWVVPNRVREMTIHQYECVNRR